MSQQTNDGGPAFPVPHPRQDRGMTLRDWFAGQALAGTMAYPNSGTYTVEENAVFCYKVADAMLKARSDNEC